MRSDSASTFRPLDAPEVALELIIDGLHLHPDATSVALVEDRVARSGLILPLTGVAPDDAAVHLDDLLLSALGDQPGCRLVLATVRPGRGGALVESDLDIWRRLVAQHRGRALELLDWFVIDEGGSLSMAALSGHPTYW